MIMHLNPCDKKSKRVNPLLLKEMQSDMNSQSVCFSEST